ncbi:MAG: agmatinase family protein [Cyclobacteriaceae bacterium]|jgi:agmatinase
MSAEVPFDDDGPGIAGQLFGLPFSQEQAALVIVPVPWEVTVSYGSGTAAGPQAVLNSSVQVDLFSVDQPYAWKKGVCLAPMPQSLLLQSEECRQKAIEHIELVSSGKSTESSLHLPQLNAACESLNIYVKNTTAGLLREGKRVGLLGGDHSTPLGFIRALSERYERFGILHIDAHADLRKAYEGFLYSHASIMYNALKLPAVSRLVQVGIRDYCEEEVDVMNRSAGRVKTFFDSQLKTRLMEGETWKTLVSEIVLSLPDHVYISLDIDGLDPSLAPNTGTPVPGGLSFPQCVYLLQQVKASGKKVIGFDLVEVSGTSEWDANVGARMLWELCKVALA